MFKGVSAFSHVLIWCAGLAAGVAVPVFSLCCWQGLLHAYGKAVQHMHMVMQVGLRALMDVTGFGR
jgi:hypothetical protein